MTALLLLNCLKKAAEAHLHISPKQQKKKKKTFKVIDNAVLHSFFWHMWPLEAAILYCLQKLHAVLIEM